MVILNTLIISILWISVLLFWIRSVNLSYLQQFSETWGTSVLSFNYNKPWGSLQLTSTAEGKAYFSFLWELSNSKKKEIIKSVSQCWCSQDQLNTPFLIEKNVQGIFRAKSSCPCRWRTKSCFTGAGDPGLLITLPRLPEVKEVSPTFARWFSLGKGCYSTQRGIRICLSAQSPSLIHDELFSWF